MKLKIPHLILILFVMLSCQAIAQKNHKLRTQPVQYQENVEAPLTVKELALLREVYQDKLEKYVLSNPQRIKDFKHLLRNRLIIKKMPQLNKESDKFTLLSSIPLFNNYNTNLVRDESFDINTFNPLKYNLEFFRIGSIIYKIDNTDYFIVIETQNLKQ